MIACSLAIRWALSWCSGTGGKLMRIKSTKAKKVRINARLATQTRSMRCCSPRYKYVIRANTRSMIKSSSSSNSNCSIVCFLLWNGVYKRVRNYTRSSFVQGNGASEDCCVSKDLRPRSFRRSLGSLPNVCLLLWGLFLSVVVRPCLPVVAIVLYSAGFLPT